MGRRGKGRSEFVTTDHEMFRRVRSRTDRASMGVMAERNIYSPAIHASSAVENALSGGTFTGDSRPVEDRVPRRRSDVRESARKEQKQYYAPLFSRDGVRKSLLVGVMTVMAMVMAAVLIVGAVRTGNQRSANRELADQLVRINQRCTAIQEQIDSARDEITTAYSAKDHGLVASGSLPVVALEAPEDAKMTPVQTAAMPAEMLAIILGH